VTLDILKVITYVVEFKPVKKREGKIPVLHYVICTLTNGSTQLQFQTSPLALAAVSNTTAQRKETEANLLFVSPVKE
jgi:hypothetical protein